jgi:hypothetical protein
MAKSENDQRIDYIEMNVADIGRSKAFYGAAFGWTFKDYGPGYCEFADGRSSFLAAAAFTFSIPTATSWPSGRRRSRYLESLSRLARARALPTRPRSADGVTPASAMTSLVMCG